MRYCNWLQVVSDGMIMFCCGKVFRGNRKRGRGLVMVDDYDDLLIGLYRKGK